MSARNHIEVVAKAMRVLEVMADGAGSKTLGEVSRSTGLGKSTVFRLLFTLRELGYVDRNDFRGTYSLNLKVLALAQGAKAGVTLTRIARPHMEALRDDIDESVWLGERRPEGVYLVDVAEVSHPLRLLLKLGDDCPIHASAAGKVIFAFMKPEEQETALTTTPLRRFTPKTNTDPAVIREESQMVRAKGYAINDEETVEGGIALGAPIFDASGEVVASVSVTAPAARWKPDQLERNAHWVMDRARQISDEFARLDYRHPGIAVTPVKSKHSSGVSD